MSVCSYSLLKLSTTLLQELTISLPIGSDTCLLQHIPTNKPHEILLLLSIVQLAVQHLSTCQIGSLCWGTLESGDIKHITRSGKHLKRRFHVEQPSCWANRSEVLHVVSKVVYAWSPDQTTSF
jgi:hypothetical protein